MSLVTISVEDIGNGFLALFGIRTHKSFDLSTV